MSKLADKPLLWILLVGMTLTLPAAMGQRADENPSRDTIRAQLDAHPSECRRKRDCVL